MKHINLKLAFCIACMAFSTSCSDDFLVEDPKDTLFADALFVNKDGFRQGLNAIYALAREERIERLGDSHVVSLMWITGTDVAWGNYDYGGLRPYDIYGSNLNPAASTLNSVFNWLYDVVNASNTLIARAEDSAIDWQGSSAEENDANKKLVIAQARIMRAWAYRHLTLTWGDIPLSTQEIDGNNFKTYFERTPLAEVRAIMEEDLLYAEQNLPDNYVDPLVLSKAVAQHYLAELYLTIGGDENYAKAEQKAEAAIANPNFSLITERFGSDKSKPGVPFMDQFGDENALASKGNTETLWTFLNAFELTGSADVDMRRAWVNRYYNLTKDDDWAIAEYGGRGIGRASHTLYVEDLYEDQDDRYSAYALSKFYLKEEGGDTIFTKVPTFAKWKHSDAYWPSTKKWDSYPNKENANSSAAYNNMPYLRLAETYLLAAEAELRLNKLEEAAEHINALRIRANATPISASDVTVAFLLDERARELLSEGHRRYVLNRFGLLVSRTKEFNKFSEIEEKNILYPIPQNFIDSNDGPTPQNPGY